MTYNDRAFALLDFITWLEEEGYEICKYDKGGYATGGIISAGYWPYKMERIMELYDKSKYKN